MCRCHVVPYPSLTIINRPSRSPAILRFTTSSSWLLLLFTTTPIWQRTQLFQQVCTALPLRHDLCLTSQLSTALLYYTLTAWYYPHHSHLLPTTTRRFTSVHYHSNLPIPPLLFVTRRSISLLQLLPIITRLCLALHMQWSITLTTSNTSHKYLPLRIVTVTSRIAPHYSL